MNKTFEMTENNENISLNIIDRDESNFFLTKISDTYHD